MDRKRKQEQREEGDSEVFGPRKLARNSMNSLLSLNRGSERVSKTCYVNEKSNLHNTSLADQYAWP